MSQYQPEAGTEQYVHVRVTHKQGQAVEPKTELYHPVNVAAVMGLTGFKGEILHDPRTAAQKHQDAPAADTVKADEPLSSADSYRARYRTLFSQDAPFNLTDDEVKIIVDRAEAKLAELATGVEPAPVETDETPTDKAGWYALFQKTFPEDATAYEDITVPKMREKLGK